MPCDPLITDPFIFPRRVQNRPGLPRIAYRIGRYDDFAEAMIRAIDAAPALAGWTHRDADDPAIALLQGAAILGDILTFYQEHYANEAFLRTAAWRESVAELVRLTGYRLAPGIGGRATLAFEVRGEAPVTIGAGFAVKAELAGDPTPADFETDAELAAWPHLSRFHLYRPRRYAATLPAGTRQLELASVAGASDSISVGAVAFKPGDRLLLLPPEPGWTSAGSTLSAQKAAQLVRIARVTRLLDRVLIDLDGALDEAWEAPVTAYRIGRSFRHFGHSAPPQITTPTTGPGGAVTGARISATSFDRHVDASHDCTNSSASAPLAPADVPLDVEVSDLVPGTRLIVQTRVAATAAGTRFALCVARTLRTLRAGALGFGNLNGPTTVLTLDAPLVRQVMSPWPLSDVRDWRIHEVTSPVLGLRPVSDPLATAFGSGTRALRFYGSAAQARALAGRRLSLSHADGRSLDLVCVDTPDQFPALDPDPPRMWPLSFDRVPAPFSRGDFDEAKPTVTVFGNLADASQGKTEREAFLGNGDSRQRFQTFPLPKAPLTYLLAAGATPPQLPELQVWVDDRLWTRVDSLFGRGPADTVYIVREDAQQRSFVQFGDGETGARLPSGVKNVRAIYRSGTGARGALKAGATPTASERPPGFDKLALAGIVSGGADPEDLEKAREAAPGKVQSLGRLVSLRDYETETLSIPGVVTATASWDLHAGVPAVILRVLLAAGREAEFSTVRAAIVKAQRCRGPDRFALVIEQARLRHVFLDLVYAAEARLRRGVVEDSLRSALGLAGDSANERTGLFGLHARRLGDGEYASRIEGRVQNVQGVLWCKVAAFGLFPPPAGGSVATDPATQPLPPAPRPLAARLGCGPAELLQLAGTHLTLGVAAEPVSGACE